MTRTIRLLGLMMAIAFGAACGGDSSSPNDTQMGADGGADGSTVVAAAPTVISTTPEDGAIGVASEAVLVFTFSEAMDSIATEAAYTSDDLPAEKVDFQWNDGGDVLTVIPIDPLELAEGDASVAPRSYSATIGAGARNTTGAPMAAAATTTFTTLRRITLYATIDSTRTGRATSAGVVSTAMMTSGDFGTNATTAAFATFGLEAVPDSVIVEHAFFSVDESLYAGAPDDDLGGPLSAHHVVFDGLDYAATLLDAVPNTIALQRSKSAPYSRSIDLADFVNDDLDNRVARENRCQVRLRYPLDTDDDDDGDAVGFAVDSLSLRVVYLAP